jgi:transposase
MALRARAMTLEEVEAIRGLAHSRTESARAVERAKIIWRAHQGQRVGVIARQFGIAPGTVRLWLTRFNAQGLAGLADEPRGGRPATYTPEQVGLVIAASLTKPTELGRPFASWTLDRLQVYLNEEKGIAIKRSRIDELLRAEGLRWRSQEGWFGERAGREQEPDAADPPREQPVDPEFAQKRGQSSRSTRHRPRAA